jgi:hypothetical protein
MQYIIIFKQHGALNCEQVFYGPYADYTAADLALCDGSVPCLYGQGGRPRPEGCMEQNGHRYIQPLTEAGRPSFALRFPMLLATCLQMDCSGGPVYDTAMAFEDQCANLLVGPWQLEDLRNAERELAQFSGVQLEWIALGGPHSDIDPPEGVTAKSLTLGTERVLNALYGSDDGPYADEPPVSEELGPGWRYRDYPGQGEG